ncbi:glycerophosphodiester phosphodiesterase 1-like [Salarias fasciatus]|uniref:Glycerophosphodiester phosphodiesterase 1-like n=1 Tax=Salarias fasciatus TaxID=181472 RepID=A0A672G216_SALFA|nr:glycerophosphodiester phosphodiesterase 1-like [Salarias fasciatus]
MLQVGDEALDFSVLFLLVFGLSRSAAGSSLLTASLYVFVVMFRFPPVPADRAGRVLRPRSLSGGVPVVAHRGGGHDAPENTVAAIREASRNGATGVELDLSFSSDGVPVLMHDETVDRTTNGSGPVSKLQFVQLRRLDASARHRLKDRFSGEKVPTLQEAVQECIKHQMVIFFDVKGQPDKAASVLHEVYKKFPVLYNSSIVSSLEPKVIYKMRQTDPSVVTALTHRPWRLSRFGDGTPRTLSTWGQLWTGLLDILLDWAHHHILWKLCGISAILVQKDFISHDYVQYWAERGVEVVGWTVNTAVEKDYYQNVLKISYITDSLLEDCDPHL